MDFEYPAGLASSVSGRLFTRLVQICVSSYHRGILLSMDDTVEKSSANTVSPQAHRGHRKKRVNSHILKLNGIGSPRKLRGRSGLLWRLNPGCRRLCCSPRGYLCGELLRGAVLHLPLLRQPPQLRQHFLNILHSFRKTVRHLRRNRRLVIAIEKSLLLQARSRSVSTREDIPVTLRRSAPNRVGPLWLNAHRICSVQGRVSVSSSPADGTHIFRKGFAGLTCSR